MLRSFIVLLCLGFVCATLQNFTIDDTSPDVQYSEAKLQCNLTTCGEEITEGLSNKSATVTNGSITIPFTGIAFYAFLACIGNCSISLDDAVIANLNLTIVEDINLGQLANGPHKLVIAPTTNVTLLVFDHLIYTIDLPAKSHVGAIVGGVIGGVVLIMGILFVALQARRRKLIMRRNQRKSAVLRGITSARTNYKSGVDDGTDLPT
ncbi:hypothetical protein GGX14DRAFT_442423 [Mycena pura]|uniref:Uncharacterized protein n=1 Tax=Mycena pura TaxID=153505 RepID=A0AAD6YJL8_9AGAR|nr:hypothetical protein GGX14DRAFT_442423 [Mycena pura]